MSSFQRETYHHGQLRPELIAQAKALVAEAGPEAVSLREAARRSGVSATATYRHFRDKEALLAAVAAEGFREFTAALVASIADGQPFSAMGRTYVEFALARPGLFRLMFSPLIRDRDQHPELAEAAERAFEALRAAARHGRGGGGGGETTAVAAWSLAHGLARLLLDGVLPAEHANALIEAVLDSASFA